MDRIRTWFSEQTIFAPFGRYEGTRRADEPANQVLIGREKERARFLDLLFSRGRTGAVLVTGQRGAGKTSFVNYCLNEYRQDIYRRWLATNVGRTLFWDRIANLALCCAAPLLALLLASELAQRMLEAEKLTLIEWIVLAAVSLVTLFPLLAGFQTLKQILLSLSLAPRAPSAKKSITLLRKRFGFWNSLIGLVVAGGLWIFFVRGRSPEVALSQLLLLTSSLTLVGAVFGVRVEKGVKQARIPRFQEILLPWSWWEVLPTYFFFTLVLVLVCSFNLPDASNAEEVAHHSIFYGIAACFSLGCASLVTALNRAIHIRSRNDGDYRWSNREPLRWNIILGTLLGVPSFFLLVFFSRLGVSSAPSLWFMNSVDTGAFLVFVNLFLGLALMARFLRHRQDFKPNESLSGAFKVRPPIRLFLVLKVVCLVAIGLQLSAPLIEFSAAWLKEPHPLMPQVIGKILHASGSVLDPATQGGSPGSGILNRTFGLFCRENHFLDLVWVFSGGVLLLFLGALEFSWIVRAGASVRDDVSLRRSPRVPRADWSASGEEWSQIARQNISRELADSSFFSLIFGSWLPVLVVPVNLGFDDLDYRRVVDAMLAGLRNHYYQSFLHWRHPFVAGKKILFVAVLGVSAVLLGNYFFALSATKNRVLEGRLARGDYCEWAVGSGSMSANRPPVPKLLWLCCKTGKEWLIQALQWRPFSPEDNTSLRRNQWSEIGKEAVCFKLPYAMIVICSGPMRTFPMFSEELGFHQGWGKPEAASSGEAGSRQAGLISVIFPEGGNPLEELRIYHFLMLFFLWLTHRGLSRFMPLSLHRAAYQRITELHEHLSSSIREELPPEVAGPVSFATSIFRHKVRQKAMDPLDPRTVEVRFLRMLEELHNREARLPFAREHLISLPSPDIIFVFDELDKIGVGRVLMPVEPATEPGREAAAPMIKGRERAKQLHLLFGDLKNLLSSARARFVFLGARNLHDESLADYTDRNPLLSNIFDEDIYLPSLLSDLAYDFRQQVDDIWLGEPMASATRASKVRPIQDHYLVPLGVEHFLYQNYWRGWELAASYHRKRATSWLMPWSESRQASAYTRSGSGWFIQRPKVKRRFLNLYSCSGEGPISWFQSEPFYREFLQFLAYRSLGNVKRLRALIESFIDPTGHVYVGPDEMVDGSALDGGSSWTPNDDEHVLAFGDVDRFRVQLIASIYRELLPALEDKISDGDDKLVTGILYLSDYVLKFHRRGFTWANLGRLDELVHIHRPPELRRIIEQVVVAWSDRFLHPIRNGMYDYRFESTLARELAYVSARSERELAAFNFTLDESQALKAVFQARLKALGGEEAQDFIAGLGELHEFDEEYEMARYYYRQAIRYLDRRLYQSPSEEESGEVEALGLSRLREALGSSAVYEAMKGSRGAGSESIRLHISWAVARLRLMLQIAMTFEQSRDLEHARTEYRSARTLAMSVIEGMIEDLSGNSILPRDFIMTVKNLNILFQPAFAEAWVSEKLASGVDTAPALLERALESLRRILPPSVRREALGEDVHAESPEQIRHMNFSLTMAELHDKVGDLYFFKGRQPPTPGGTCVGEAQTSYRREGYLLRAYDHYATALHEVRRYNSYRLTSSRHKLNSALGDRWETHAMGMWPDFNLRTAAGAFVDLADCLLARVSIAGLIEQCSPPEGKPRLGEEMESTLEKFFVSLDSWLESPSREQVRAADFGSSGVLELQSLNLGELVGGEEVQSGSISDWLGVLVERGGDLTQEGSLQSGYELRFDMRSRDLDRFVCSLVFGLYGARLLEMAGYQEASARERFRAVQTIVHLLWWVVLAATLSDLELGEGEAKEWKDYFDTNGAPGWNSPTIISLIRLARLALEEAVKLFSESRAWTWSGGQRPRIPVWEDLPPRVISTICSLGLALTTATTRSRGECFYLDEHVGLLRLLSGIWPEWSSQAMLQLWGARSVDEVVQGSWGGMTTLIDVDGATVFRQVQKLATFYCAALSQNLAEHSYPLRDRLVGLQVLLTHAAVAKSRTELKAFAENPEQETENLLWKETGHHVVEFLKLKKLYASSLHFSPTLSGLPLAVISLRLRDGGDRPELKKAREDLEEAGISVETILRVAQQDLTLSQEMYSMRRGYYEAISDLYYLYDDFNDRTVHYNHAVQIAASELAAFCLALIRNPPSGDPKGSPAQRGKATPGTEGDGASQPAAEKSSQPE